MAQQLIPLSAGRQLPSLIAIVPGLLREAFFRWYGLLEASPSFHRQLCRLPDHDMLA
ncbi:hypothetical protein [Bradyrhizobium sp. CB1650]|uniref:hypothetical protein n=1 Tax=Bradyrhizobium sp. CB1650 TaxID=3039153 RepID=UPI00325FD203